MWSVTEGKKEVVLVLMLMLMLMLVMLWKAE